MTNPLLDQQNQSLLRWEPDARNKAIARITSGSSSEPGAAGPGTMPSGVSPGGTQTIGDWAASLVPPSIESGPSARQMAQSIYADEAAKGQKTPPVADLIKLAALFPGDIAESVLNALVTGVTAPGDALSGKLQVTDPDTGLPTPQAMGAALDLAGVAGGGTFAGAPEAGVDTVLGSGPVRPKITPDVATDPLYSQAAKVVQDLPTTRATADQWLATLKNKGVKADELDALNLPTGPQVYSKADVQHMIQIKTPQLTDIVKGAVQPADLAKLDGYDARILAGGQLSPAEQAEYNQLTDAESLPNTSGAATKYSQYQLPGGENYREILTTLPRPGELSPAERAEYTQLQTAQQDGYPLNEAQAARYKQLATRDAQASTDPNVYRSSHWDEPNVIAHTRVNDRVIQDPGFSVYNRASGNKSPVFATSDEANAYKAGLPASVQANTYVIGDTTPVKTLHVEELQSDWHQEGKKNGYKDNSTDTSDAAVLARAKTQYEGVYPTNKWDDLTEAQQQYLINVAKLQTRQLNERSVPDAPFKKTWPDLLIKKLATRAVDEGYDAISWTDGQTQADRYDLSKSVGSVKYSEITGQLVAYNPDGEIIINKSGISPQQLPDYIGKEGADKLLASKDGDSDTYHELSGQDLKVGGEGMKAFYDQEIPRRTSKILGVKPTTRPLTGTAEAGAADWERYQQLSRMPYADRIRTGVQTEYEKLLDRMPEGGGKPPQGAGATVHFVRFTPEVKARVRKGFPLYSAGVPVPAPTNQQPQYTLTPVPHNPFTHTLTPVQGNPFGGNNG